MDRFRGPSNNRRPSITSRVAPLVRTGEQSAQSALLALSRFRGRAPAPEVPNHWQGQHFADPSPQYTQRLPQGHPAGGARPTKPEPARTARPGQGQPAGGARPTKPEQPGQPNQARATQPEEPGQPRQGSQASQTRAGPASRRSQINKSRAAPRSSPITIKLPRCRLLRSRLFNVEAVMGPRRELFFSEPTLKGRVRNNRRAPHVGRWQVNCGGGC